MATAALLIIGNEILSGRTAEKNLSALAELLGERGWRLAEARVVRDEQAAIVAALGALRDGHDCVFTSGGIGATHDDITTDAVAAAFGTAAEEDAAAAAKLGRFYAERNLPFTAARRRMARLPAGAAIVEGDYPGAPAYRVGNVVVCAGVPAIFRRMAAAAVALLPAGVCRAQSALRVLGGETAFADALAGIAARHPQTEIGSYPRDEGGAFGAQVVFSAEDAAAVDAAKTEFAEYLTSAGIPYQPL